MMDDFFDQGENSMPRIGDLAPAFRSVTTQGTIYFPADYSGKWVILFNYPTDFTPAPTSEFMAFTTINDDFKALNCELIGLPFNKLHNQIAGLSSIKEKIECKGIKDIEIKFRQIEDITTDVARKYGMIKPYESNTKAVRAVFFIDTECKIRALIQYPLSLNLNFDELKRVIVTLQTEDEAISPPAKSFGIAKKLLETKKVSKKFNEWNFCTRELSEEKMVDAFKFQS